MITNCTSITSQNHWFSMYEEYNWVCSDSQQFLAAFQSLLPIGYFLGHMISGHLSDYFGRKWVFIAGELYGVLSGIACALIPSFTVYSIFMIIGSVVGSISEAASVAWIVESVNPKYRLIQGFSFQYMLGLMVSFQRINAVNRRMENWLIKNDLIRINFKYFAFQFAGILAGVVRNWRTHLLISRLIEIPAIFMLLILEESPRFLLQKRRFKEAANALTRIARFNRVKNTKFTPEQMTKIYAIEERAKQKSRE